MQFGSSSHAIFFKMRVAGVLHIFKFETRQGDDICMALQTHISDIMMKRYAKAKEVRKSTTSTGLSQANFGPKYDQHLKQMQMRVEEATHRIEELEKNEKDAEYKTQEQAGELEGVKTQIEKYKKMNEQLQTEKNRLKSEVATLKDEYEEFARVIRIKRTS